MSFEASALFLSRLHFTVACGIAMGDRRVTTKENERILFKSLMGEPKEDVET